MFGFETKVTGNVLSKVEELADKQKKLYKDLSRLIGDAISDYDLIGNFDGSDEGSSRLMSNYMKVMSTSKEYCDKMLESNLELAAAIDDLTAQQKEQNEKLDRIIKLLEKKN